MIVLIVALTFVMGSAGVIDPAKPGRTAVAAIDSVNATGFYVHWMWTNWGASGYQLQICDLSDPATACWTGDIERQDENTKYMATADYPNPVHYTFDTLPPDPTHNFTIQLTLFKKDGSTLTQASGSWSPTFYTVILDESNDLANVAIQVFLDSGLTNPIGDQLTTDIAGNAVIDLPDRAKYYYRGAKTNYYDFSHSFTLAGASLTEHFAMKPYDTVTFAETNELSDVSIRLYTDSGFQDPVGDPLTTNSSGEAAIKLPNQAFHYTAVKTGYSDTSGSFTLFDGPAEVQFEMLPALYDVTFDERNGLGGVSIVVYSEPERTADLVSMTTKSSGQATCMLSDGTYYYRARKVSYRNLLGDFTVSGGSLTERFRMVPIPVSHTVTFDETNALEGVLIVVYSNAGRTEDVVSRTTDSLGQATCTLPDGTYYYTATRASYADLLGDFTVAGDPLTEGFEMLADVRTVTFNEMNALEAVSIVVYSDPDRTEDIASGTTNSSGQVTCTLPDGSYYYTATKASYVDLLGDFAVSGAPLTEGFEMLAATYIVTFSETNGLEGISIVVYSDPDRTEDIISRTTNSTGQATCTLPDGSYYYTATKASYVDLLGDFAVSGAPLTEGFEMLAATYIVTFNETSSLEGVSIVVYSDPDRTEDVASRTTDSSGQATCALPDGTYYYTATKASHTDLLGDFTVSGTHFTESFEMLPILYTVTFDETNGLEDVSIVVYSDPDRTEEVASRTTNSTGQATCTLPDGAYYYTATKASYVDLLDDFTVSVSSLAESFEMLPVPYTVTFNETNGLEDVSIMVYSDPDRTEDIASGTTDSSGQATCTLPDGTYYYTATKVAYVGLLGDFTVLGSPLTETFEMAPLPSYTVTFNETNGLEDVSIVVYSDPDRTEDVASGTTNSSGQVSCTLPDGTYYYRATKASYANLLSDFTVSGAPLNESFEMLTGSTPFIVFEEDFAGVPRYTLPSGWTATDSALCGVSNSNHALGSVPELRLGCGPDYDVYMDYYAATPSIDAAATGSALDLSFKSFFSLYGDDPSYPYTYVVQTSDDSGATWTTVLEETPTLATYPSGEFQRTETIDISDCIGQTIMIRWRLYGYTWWMNAWHVDDIVVIGY